MKKIPAFSPFQRLLTAAVLVGLLLSAACVPASLAPVPPANDATPIPGLAETLAAQTIAANPQILSLLYTYTPSPAPPSPTATATATAEAAQPASSPAADTPAPSLTPISLAASALTPSVPPEFADAPCNRAEFVQDMSIPDDSVIAPGKEFVKIWRLRNVGSCAWTALYSAVLVWGTSFGANTQIPLEQVVNPGEIFDLAIRMVAPLYPDCYQSNWMLQDEAGNRFGTGPSAKGTFWVAISVWEPNLGVPLRKG